MNWPLGKCVGKFSTKQSERCNGTKSILSAFIRTLEETWCSYSSFHFLQNLKLFILFVLDNNINNIWDQINITQSCLGLVPCSLAWCKYKWWMRAWEVNVCGWCFLLSTCHFWVSLIHCVCWHINKCQRLDAEYADQWPRPPLHWRWFMLDA